VPTVRLTVPEGLRISTTYPGERSISSEVADQTGLSAKEFASLADSGRYALPPFLPRSARTTEGFLFPDTYQLLRKGLTPDAVIRRMLEQFQTEAESLDLAGGAERLELTPYQVVIVASMIEREAQVEEDRPKIASVIYNRLAQGMSLGIDATLLYDDPTPDGQLSTSDLLTNNPYNTRINAGLPPTPIASPGRASLDAALHPADTPYLYYVLCAPDGDGVHRFARTLHEHNVNVHSVWAIPWTRDQDPRRTRTVGIIGWPEPAQRVAGDPQCAFAALDLTGPTCPPGRWGCSRSGLRLRTPGFAGVNVTMPHKTEVAEVWMR
jgi:UPF0755 protein